MFIYINLRTNKLNIGKPIGHINFKWKRSFLSLSAKLVITFTFHNYVPKSFAVFFFYLILVQHVTLLLKLIFSFIIEVWYLSFWIYIIQIRFSQVVSFLIYLNKFPELFNFYKERLILKFSIEKGEKIQLHNVAFSKFIC